MKRLILPLAVVLVALSVASWCVLAYEGRFHDLVMFMMPKTRFWLIEVDDGSIRFLTVKNWPSPQYARRRHVFDGTPDSISPEISFERISARRTFFGVTVRRGDVRTSVDETGVVIDLSAPNRPLGIYSDQSFWSSVMPAIEVSGSLWDFAGLASVSALVSIVAVVWRRKGGWGKRRERGFPV